MNTKKKPAAKKVPRTSRKNLKKPARRPSKVAPTTKTITYYATVDSAGGALLDRYDVWTEEPQRTADLRRVVWCGTMASYVGFCTRGVLERWLGNAPTADNQIAVTPFTYTETPA